MDKSSMSKEKENSQKLDFATDNEEAFDDHLFDFSKKIDCNKNTIFNEISANNMENQTKNDWENIIRMDDEKSFLAQNEICCQQYYLNESNQKICQENEKNDLKSSYLEVKPNITNDDFKNNIVSKKNVLSPKLRGFPHYFINISNNSNYRIYDYLFQITGAYLTQNELIYLRKNLFYQVMPPMIRDEQRSKIKNIECFEAYHNEIIPILQMPNIQFLIQNCIFNRRNNNQKIDILFNVHNLHK